MNREILPQNTLADDYRVPTIIVGCWQLAGGHGKIDHNRALENLCRYFDAGFTTFDSADIYTGVEELLGRFRKVCVEKFGTDAKRLKIHTKYVPDLDDLSSLEKRKVKTTIDRSLARLGTERLDLVQFHWWDVEIPGYVETSQILQELKSEGKIRHIGLTNFDTDRTTEIVFAGVEILSTQIQYSVLDRRPEKSLADYTLSNEIGLFCYGTLAGGFLSERYLGKPEPEMSLENRSLVKYKLMIDEIGGWENFQNILRALQKVAAKHEVSISNVAMRYVLEKPAMASVIVGMRHANHLDETLRSVAFPFDNEDRELLEDTLASLPEVDGEVYELERRKTGNHASVMKYNLNKSSD